MFDVLYINESLYFQGINLTQFPNPELVIQFYYGVPQPDKVKARKQQYGPAWEP